ncbi:hypothetical protein [Flavisolibacter ginsengisoli]|jgi:hypothetical protein|uniref:Uncharacterized protein n=1 Tax=Flavisolibacter ginsengisoli DSM 18119 TaxID=1121884 RepID=A0A1M5FSD8_9BACT|nr:hypothetical protein [Flavisolibacter ginsengisoli]SHF94467.1 hypothetical protein SAMN02745131_03934 [Flavisolibacter ginsengisoli DSM 18119]
MSTEWRIIFSAYTRYTFELVDHSLNFYTRKSICLDASETAWKENIFQG